MRVCINVCSMLSYILLHMYTLNFFKLNPTPPFPYAYFFLLCTYSFPSDFASICDSVAGSGTTTAGTGRSASGSCSLLSSNRSLKSTVDRYLSPKEGIITTITCDKTMKSVYRMRVTGLVCMLLTMAV